MNSTEFKKLLMTEPGSTDPAFLAMANSGDENGKVYSEAMAFETLLSSALRVPVPEGLAEEIITDHAVAGSNSGRFWDYRSLMGLAAALVIGFGITVLQPFGSKPSYGDFIVEHMAHEPAALMSKEEVAFEDTKWLFAKYGAEITNTVGKVTYLQRCPMLSKTGIHMVLQTPQGAVTVFFMPEESVAETLLVQADGIDGVVVGLDNAAMAIIGSPGQALGPIERQLRSAIKTI